MTNTNQVKRLWQKLLDSMREEGVFIASGVEQAFSTVPRHLFLPGIPVEDVYENRPIGLKHDQGGLLISSSSQPTMMAIMLNQLQLQPGDNVLEIGTASGYNAAIMKQIVGEQGSVTTIELDVDLAQQAIENLSQAQMRDVHVVQGDGAMGYSPRASYDAIIVTAGVWDIPSAWISQLKPDGVLVAPVIIDGVQISACFRPCADGTLLSKDNRPCAFVYMRGSSAAPNFRRRVGSTGLLILADEVQKIDTIALHSLISGNHELCQLEYPMTAQEYWTGYQLYMMLNEPSGSVFMVYAVVDGQQAYGLDGRGIALYTPGSISFVPYHASGEVHCFAGSESFVQLHSALDDWLACGRPGAEQMRVQIYPKSISLPEIEIGKIYTRRDNDLHVWLHS